jgi:hypothetical protein
MKNNQFELCKLISLVSDRKSQTMTFAFFDFVQQSFDFDLVTVEKPVGRSSIEKSEKMFSRCKLPNKDK